MAKRTPEQLTALFTEMGEAEVAKALSSRKWRTKAYNTLALGWLTKARTAEATEKPVERSKSPAKGNTVPKVAEDKAKAVETRRDVEGRHEDRKAVQTHKGDVSNKPSDNKNTTPNKPKGAK